MICVGIERIYGAVALVFCLLANRFVSNSDVNILFAIAEKRFSPVACHSGEGVALGIYACPGTGNTDTDNSWQQDIRSCR